MTVRRWALVGGSLLVAALVAVLLVLRHGQDDETRRLAIDWGDGEGHPGCRYDPATRTVEAVLVLDGRVPRPDRLRIVVTAYADENTSVPVGSASRTLRIHGEVHRRLRLTIPVTRPPHVGEDDEAACARTLAHERVAR